MGLAALDNVKRQKAVPGKLWQIDRGAKREAYSDSYALRRGAQIEDLLLPQKGALP